MVVILEAMAAAATPTVVLQEAAMPLIEVVAQVPVVLVVVTIAVKATPLGASGLSLC